MSRTYDSDKQITFDSSGMDEFTKLLKEFTEKVTNESNVFEILKVGADALVDDALRLPKPISKIHASGYTHMVNTFANKVNKARKEVEVGWGKYYGPMVEHGTVKMSAKMHLQPLFYANQDRYAKLMKDKFYD